MSSSWPGSAPGSDLMELAALAAAEAGDVATFGGLRPGLSYRTVVECLAIMKGRFGWDPHMMLFLHLMVGAEENPPAGVTLTIDWAKLLGEGSVIHHNAKPRALEAAK